jgi:N6-L-threonylcarbamoyladenine synthase
MIAFAGYLRLADGQHDDLTVQVRPRWPMTELAPVGIPGALD